jgi:hypothetical protein
MDVPGGIHALWIALVKNQNWEIQKGADRLIFIKIDKYLS